MRTDLQKETVFITKIIDLRTIEALAKQRVAVRFRKDGLHNRESLYNECFPRNRHVLTNIHIFQETVNRENRRNMK